MRPEFKAAEESFMTKHHQGPSPQYRYEHYDPLHRVGRQVSGAGWIIP
jgi:hypothetical protein